MTGNEFKLARKLRLKYSQAELAIAMKTSKRTLQDIEAQGDKEIKGVYAVCIELLIWKGVVLCRVLSKRSNGIWTINIQVAFKAHQVRTNPCPPPFKSS